MRGALASRTPQRIGSFEPGHPVAGYYNDLTSKPLALGKPDAALAALAAMTADRGTANPVAVAQLGLGAWQLTPGTPAWAGVAIACADWLTGEMEEDGRIPYRFPMAHTYVVDAPWSSAMAQGEAASLLVRVAALTGRDAYAEAAVRAIAPLLDAGSDLVTETPEGPVLQEYPTTPASDVLNGWLFALWGLYDVAHGTPGEEHAAVAAAAAGAFAAGVACLDRRIGRYDAALGWSRYDLYPHPIVHVASPFYHRLHIAQLRATLRLTGPSPGLDRALARWSRAERSTVAGSVAVVRKIAFRLLRPRGTRR